LRNRYEFWKHHRFDADPDPDSTFHFDADPDPDPDPDWRLLPQGLQMLENRAKLLLLFTARPVYHFFLFLSWQMCQDFMYFGQHVEIFIKY
jgi:hypothetical protein